MKKITKKIISFFELILLLGLFFFDWIFQGIFSLLKKFFSFLSKKFSGVPIIVIMLVLWIDSYLRVSPIRWMQRINKVVVITFFVVAIVFAIELAFEFFNKTEPSWFLFIMLGSLIALLYFGFKNRKEFY